MGLMVIHAVEKNETEEGARECWGWAERSAALNRFVGKVALRK